MDIKTFVENYKAKKFMTALKSGVDEKSEWLRKELEIKNYIPFMEKRKIAEAIVEQNIEVVDGIKKYDSINGYIGLIVASIMAHTNLKFSMDPIGDYDLLAESGLLSLIIAAFQESYNEIDVLLKMALAMELEDNNASALIGRFLDSVLKKFDNISKLLGNINLNKIFDEESAAKIVGLFNK